MVEGFWIVQFEGVQGNGGGVIVLLKGRVFGGDSGFIYTGTYQNDENTITARVLVHNFLPGVPSVLGVQADVELLLKGTIAQKVVKATASVAGQGIAGLVVKLTKVSDLPGDAG
jgi:transketolase C-terminal domain/subunit